MSDTGDLERIFGDLGLGALPTTSADIRVIEDVSSRYPDLAMIAVSHKSDPESILAPMRAGCDQFVCEPIDGTDLAHAVSRVASRRLSGNTKSRCICVAGASGGSGATSIYTWGVEGR